MSAPFRYACARVSSCSFVATIVPHRRERLRFLFGVAAHEERFICRPFLHMIPTEVHPEGHAHDRFDLRRFLRLQKAGGFLEAQGWGMGGW